MSENMPTPEQVREAYHRMSRHTDPYTERPDDRATLTAALSDDFVRVPRVVLEQYAREGDTDRGKIAYELLCGGSE